MALGLKGRSGEVSNPEFSCGIKVRNNCSRIKRIGLSLISKILERKQKNMKKIKVLRFLSLILAVKNIL